MLRKLLWVMLLLFVPAMLFAQNGKVRGIVTDQETGEPLIGANVTIEGTSLGASSNMTGTYIVLAVSPGVYTIRATYIGYQGEAIQNIRVNSGLTTTQDFGLSTTAIRGEELVVIAERPLIQRNTTNTIRMTTEEDIQYIPIRGLQNILSLDAGTVLQDGTLHVRGGRAGEVAYYVDGVTGTNPVNNTQSLNVIQEAVEEIQMQAGGYTAEYGGGNSAVVRTTMRTGGPQFKVSLDYRTDDFVPAGQQFLGTSSYGYHNAVATVSGPVPGLSNLRFFAAGQYNYMRNRAPSYVEPMEFTGLTDDGYTGRDAGEMLPNGGTIRFLKNHLPRNWNKDYMAQGTLVWSATDNLKFRLSGSYQNVLRPTWGNTFYESSLYHFNLDRSPEYANKTAMGSFRMTHIIDQTTFYEVGAYFSDRHSRTYDPLFGDDWQSNVDSVANLEQGYGGWRSRFWGPRRYSTIYNFEVEAPGNGYNDYDRQDQRNIGVTLDFSKQVNANWELKAGGRLDMWHMRTYRVGNPKQFLETDLGIHGDNPKVWLSDHERTVKLSKVGDVQFYGYDVDGNETDTSPYGPKQPIFASAYFQNKFEYRDLVLNLGFRWEMVNTKAWKVNDPGDPTMDQDLDWLDPSSLEKTTAEHYILPRLNFSFPVTDRTVFYALYGKYIQMPRLDQVFRGYTGLSETVSPVTRSAYGWWGNWVGYTARPEEIVQYEMGIRQSLTDNFAFTVTGFYKDQRNLLRIDRLYLNEQTGEVTADPTTGDIQYCGYVNQDFGTIKGVELTLELRRTQRLSARMNYTYSDARGTGSDSRSGSVVVSDEVTARYPILVSPLVFNQPHRGSVMLDYRFSKGDGGSILEGLGANVLLTFNSGHAYTKIEEPENLGQANPWNVGVRAMIDERGRHPQEPLNTSYTPWNFKIDLNVNKVFYLGRVNLDLYVNVLNLLNTRNVINVYQMTGTSEDDGWLSSPFAGTFFGIPNYVDFYRAINNDNRWGYSLATGNDIYSIPRQVRVGLRLEFN